MEHRVLRVRSGSLPTTAMRGRPLGPSTTSEAIPKRLRQSTAASAARFSDTRSASGSRNGPTARGSTRSLVERGSPPAPGAATVTDPASDPGVTAATDSGSTTADAWGGSGGGDGVDPAESAMIARLWVVRVIRRSDSSARPSTVAPTPCQPGCSAA